MLMKKRAIFQGIIFINASSDVKSNKKYMVSISQFLCKMGCQIQQPIFKVNLLTTYNWQK